MAKAVDHARHEFAKIRTGKATTNLLDLSLIHIQMCIRDSAIADAIIDGNELAKTKSMDESEELKEKMEAKN